MDDSLKGMYIYPFLHFLFSNAWNKNVMAGAALAILDHEISGGDKRWKEPGSLMAQKSQPVA